MKICLLAMNLYSLGGIQRVITTVLKELATDPDCSVTVVMPSSVPGKKYFAIPEGIDIQDMDELTVNKARSIGRIILGINKRTGLLNGKFWVPLIRKLRFHKKELKNFSDYINEKKFDAVIGVEPYYSCLLAELDGQVSAKRIGWQHSTFDSYVNMRKSFGYGAKAYMKECYRKLDGVWVLTKADKKQFDSELGINSSVLYNPIPVSQVEYEPQKNNILFVGRLVIGHKGLDYLVDIVDLIRKKIPDVLLTVVGDGPDRQWLADAVAKKKLEKHICIVGSTDNVYQYYQKASVMIQTSRYEGFGMTIVEAMDCGVPVVSFHNYGPDEIIRDGIDGYLINQFDLDDFADKTAKLLQDRQLWQAFSKESVARAEVFRIDRILPVFKGYIENALN